MKLLASYLLRELCHPKTYLMAAFIGLVINLLQGNGPLGSVVPYLVPVLVQVISKAEVAYRNSERELLARLPLHRADPVFVINQEGRIILGAGKGWAALAEEQVPALQALFSASDADRLFTAMKQKAEGKAPGRYYSPLLDRQYTIHYCLEGNDWLVWLTESTETVVPVEVPA